MDIRYLELGDLTSLESLHGVFSIKYENPDPDEIWAVDWDFKHKRQWARSWKERYSLMSRWSILKGLDQYAFIAILEKFGLKEYQNEFPREKVQFMSPAQLLKIRREKETKDHLPRLEVRSDTLGDHGLAEDYD